MSYEVNAEVADFSIKEEYIGEKTIIVNLDDRHTAVLSRNDDRVSVAVLDGKYDDDDDYCTKEVFPEYDQDVIKCSIDEAKRLVKDMMAIFKR